MEAGHPIAPPEIMIELYFKSGTLPDMKEMAILKKVMAQKALDFQLVFLINLMQNMKV